MLKVMVKGLFKKIHQLPYSVFLTLFIAGLVLSVGALRHNNQTMIQLRAEVFAADQADGDVNAALNNLREYVYSHMNTDLSSGGNAIKPPIQLKYTYERLLESQQQAASNSKVYNDAQTYCQEKIPASVSISGRGRIACVQDYVVNHGVNPSSIPTGLYEFDFVSPVWSPDLAGWSLVFTALMFLGFAWTFLFQFVGSKLRN